MSVPLRRNRMNGITVKVIAVVINKRRRKKLVGGVSNRLARPISRAITSGLCVSAPSMHRQPCADLVPVGALFIGIRNLKDARLVERCPQKLQPNRQFLPAL